MRKSLNASVLLLVLCCHAFAGDMLTPPIVPPPSSTTPVAPSPDDEIPDPAPTDNPTTQDILLTEIAVSILESLLPII
jgi:hypothetical protein